MNYSIKRNIRYLSHNCCLLVLCFCSYQSLAQDATEIVIRNYCTEIGRFDLVFYGDEVTGSYLLIPKNQLGAFWGRLDGEEITGRWVDGDGVGDIIVTFSTDFKTFRADYRSDEHPEKWYRDSWHGVLRPNEDPDFTYEGVTYRCE